MPIFLNRASIRVFEPGELAEPERQRLLAAIEAFVNLGDSLNDYLAFGKQNPDFFPVPIREKAIGGLEILPAPFFKDSLHDAGGERHIYTRQITWEPVAHKLVLFFRDCLRDAWHPPVPGPSDISTGEWFEILLGLETGYQYAELEKSADEIYAPYPDAKFGSSPILADWQTGTFLYMADNDFRRAVYILFREGWRVKTCERCSRRFVASKPMQRYCSTGCAGAAKRERNLRWWTKHGKKWRSKRKSSSHRVRNRLAKKRPK